MAITTPPIGDFKAEPSSLEQFDRSPEPIDGDPSEAEAQEQYVADVPNLRSALAATLPMLGAAVIAGGIFTGIAPRIHALVAVLLGTGIAVMAARIRRPSLTLMVIGGGLFAVGLLLLVPFGPENVLQVRSGVARAIVSGKLLRPPVAFIPGWAALQGWILASVACATAWAAVVLKRPSVAMLMPLPLAALAAISIPRDEQVVSGLIVLVLFAAGLGVLSGGQMAGGDEGLPPGYELRRLVRALPIFAVITVGLFLLTQYGSFLFPHPVIDPALEPQKPKPLPLGTAADRVLFEVSETAVSGPWVMGHLDVYDGHDWRLPPFAESNSQPVPRSGILDRDLKPGVKATITIKGLDGAVLPVLPNPVGVIEEGPRLAYYGRTGNLRLVEGQLQSGLTYTVAAAVIPTADSLKRESTRLPNGIGRFTAIPPPPPAVVELISRAPKSSKWEEFDYLRSYVLKEVTATGTGIPVSVPPDRVQQILTGKKEASPYEIVAVQALLGRWVGLPSRIGYGFDSGVKVGDRLQVHPSNGVSFVEVYFPDYKWLPVIGTPVHAKVSSGGKNTIQQNANVIPSNDISVPVYMPVLLTREVPITDRVRQVVVVLVPALLLLWSIYLAYPVLVKSFVRRRRRAAAAAAGPRAQIIQVYCEWRDAATDFGYRFPSDTPLMFLGRFVADEEHRELAWLVTRALWGDLQGGCTPELAADARDLSRSLQRRLAQAQPITVRMVAALSSRSLREPFQAERSRRQAPARSDEKNVA